VENFEESLLGYKFAKRWIHFQGRAEFFLQTLGTLSEWCWIWYHLQ